MDKETLSNYGWIVICTLVLAVMIALATPFGEYIKAGVWSTTNGLNDTLNKNMEIAGLSGGSSDNQQQSGIRFGEKYICTEIDGNIASGDSLYDYYIIFNEDGSGMEGSLNDDTDTSHLPEGFFTYADTEVINSAIEIEILDNGTKISFTEIGADRPYMILTHESLIEWVDESIEVDGYATFTDGTTLTWSELKAAGYNVTNMSIGERAFYNSNIKEIVIPDTVVVIRDYALHYSKIESITIPASLKCIGGENFEKTSYLKNVYITDLDAWCNINFTTDCSNPLEWADLYLNGNLVTEVTFPNGITKVNAHVFDGCESIKKVTLPEGVTSIGEDAFDCCTSLTSINIPNSVTSIDESAFEGCSALTEITIPEGITNISCSAFSECSSLKSVNLPSSLKCIDEQAFYGCESLENIIIPSNTTSICYGAFQECTSLKNIVIPNTITIIESYVFDGCVLLKSITLPQNLTSIGVGAFESCESLTSITIPNSVTNIDDDAFRYCKSLKTVNIPTSLNTINYYAFYSCDALESIFIPKNITSIEYGAFSYCDSLLSIIFEGTTEQWKTISKSGYSFNGSPVTQVTCSDGVVAIQ